MINEYLTPEELAITKRAVSLFNAQEVVVFVDGVPVYEWNKKPGSVTPPGQYARTALPSPNAKHLLDPGAFVAKQVLNNQPTLFDISGTRVD